MELVDITKIIGGPYTAQWHEFMNWLEESVGPQEYGPKKTNSELKALARGSNWRIYPVSYALHRARPGMIVPGAAIMLELDDPTGYVMFKLRWL